MYCTYCGKPLDKDARFCPNCGKTVANDMPEPRSKSKQELSNLDGISRKKIIKWVIAGLVLTAVCSPMVLIGRALALDSVLNPENRTVAASSLPISDSKQDYPNIPIVFTSDRDDPNFEECHSTNSCLTQVFYNPAPLTDPSVNLTMHLGFDLAYNPTLSPDGTKVAFGAYKSEELTNHIYVVNIDGSGLKKVSRDSFTNIYPAWSPDGTQLVYMSKPIASNFYNLYITDISSNETYQLTMGDFIDRYPSWSPDGKSIALQSNRLDPDPANCLPNCKFNLFTMDVETLSGSPIMYDGDAISGNGIDWSPDGSQKAFHANWSGNWDIYIMNADREIHQLSTTSGIDTDPRWSPDGKYIAFTSETSTGFDVVVTPVDHFAPIYYTDHAGMDIQPDW